MFSKKHRTTRQEFDEIFKKSKRWRGEVFTIKHTRAEGTHKAAVVISKKSLRSAVTRHLLKRRAFAALRAEDFLGRADGLSVCCIAHKNLKDISYDAVHRDIQSFFDSFEE